MKMRVLARYLKVHLADGRPVRLRRGQVISRDEVDPASAAKADTLWGHKRGGEAERKLIELSRHEGRDKKGRWTGIEAP